MIHETLTIRCSRLFVALHAAALALATPASAQLAPPASGEYVTQN
jgi:hypothetical protein